MSDLRTPDALSTQAENELICEKLLGLKKHCDRPDCHDWRIADGNRYWNSPSFTTWADAGLILEALQADYTRSFSVLRSLSTILKGGRLEPADVRAAALEHIRSLP